MEYIEVKPSIVFNSDSRMLEVIFAFVFSYCWDKLAGSQLQSILRAQAVAGVGPLGNAVQ